MTKLSKYWLIGAVVGMCSLSTVAAQTMHYAGTTSTPLESGGFGDTAVFPVQLIVVKTTGSYTPLTVLHIRLKLREKIRYAGTTVAVYYTAAKDSFHTAVLFAKKKLQANTFILAGEQELQSGPNFFWVAIERNPRSERVLPGVQLLSCTTGLQQYQTTWADEFAADGPPDSSNWQYEHGFVRNEEGQWYQQQNAFCKNGLLVIEARRDSLPNPMFYLGSRDWRKNREFIRYTSASINTRGKRQWTYGRWEMRARLDTNQGCWPAWWALGTQGGGWPANGEIDMMEFYRGKILANYAVATARPNTPKWFSTATPLAGFNRPHWADSFHHWRMDWDSAGIAIYLDEMLLNYQPQASLYNRTGDGSFYPFRHPQYMLLNFALGGQNGGDPSGTVFPRRYEVDYVRVLQKVKGQYRSKQVHIR